MLLKPLRRGLEVPRLELALRKSAGIDRDPRGAACSEVTDDIGRLHFVGHSMGAIVVRRALAIARPRKFGRVVLLAPPNRGARLADLGLKFFGRSLTAARELGAHPESYVNRLAPTADLDCGVIAASWDHVVSLASTHLPGERDHLVLRSLHTLPLHRRVPAQVVHFLRQGRFQRH